MNARRRTAAIGLTITGMSAIGLLFGVSACDSTTTLPEPEAQVDTLTTFASAHQFIDFSSGEDRRTIEDSFTFPANLDGYERIEMEVALECPEGGCDPWDRFASISVVDSGENLEIGRYITPYGVGCSWRVNVTDFRNYLAGRVRIRSFIDTWVASGWLVTVRFLFTQGTPSTTDITVTNLWSDQNVVYGHPDHPPLQPITEAAVDPDADSVKVRLIVTGHGQGNSKNAAEFFPAVHHLLVDGTPALEHALWKDDCERNTCSPQSGNWRSPRAGWCPGSAVEPDIVNVTPLVTPGASTDIEYRLASFANQCRPDNQACLDGLTACATCEYDGGAHTEPHYKVDVQLVTYR